MYAICVPEVLAWAPALVYFAAPWMQIVKNYRSHTATYAVSHRMLFIAVAGTTAKAFYDYFLIHPLAYRVMRPLTVLALLVLVGQAYWYTDDALIRQRTIITYTLFAVISAAFAVLGFAFPEVVGSVAGWVGMLALAFYQAPQVIKDYARRSVDGLSFSYLSLLCGGAVLEVMMTLILRLPIQSMLDGLRGMAYYGVFCYQFVTYEQEETTGR